MPDKPQLVHDTIMAIVGHELSMRSDLPAIHWYLKEGVPLLLTDYTPSQSTSIPEVMKLSSGNVEVRVVRYRQPWLKKHGSLTLIDLLVFNGDFIRPPLIARATLSWDGDIILSVSDFRVLELAGKDLLQKIVNVWLSAGASFRLDSRNSDQNWSQLNS